MRCRTKVAAALALALGLGACSGPVVDESATVVPATDAAPRELAFDDESQDGAPLRLALVRPEAIDPVTMNAGDQNSVLLVDLLYDGLTEASAAGVLRPALALAWEPADDFATWTFELDPDRISADEVVASFERLRQVGSVSLTARMLDQVETIQVIDESTVEFRLRNPQAGFPWVLSGVQFSVAAADRTTGVYQIASESEVGLSLTGEGHRPISITWGGDGNETYSKLTLAQVDAAVVDPSLSRDAAIRYGQQISARSIVRFYGLNLSSERLWDPRVREAVLSAADRPAMFSQLPGAGFSADGVASPSTAGFSYGACNGACVYDPTGARALLADAGVAPELTIGYADPAQGGVAAELATSLRKAGFGTAVVELTAEELADGIADGTVDVFSFGWAAPAGSMDAIIEPLFASYSSLNVTRLVSPEVDQLLGEAAATADDQTRWELLAQAEQAALSQWVLIPVAVAQNGLVQSPDIDPLPVRADGSIDVHAL